MANDESYRDPTNLENKLQKHQEFEAEVNANETQIQNIAKVITIINKLILVHLTIMNYLLIAWAQEPRVGYWHGSGLGPEGRRPEGSKPLPYQ